MARAAGVPTESAYSWAKSQRAASLASAVGGRANLVAANNVLAHVPAINDFVGGLASNLAGAATAC